MPNPPISTGKLQDTLPVVMLVINQAAREGIAVYAIDITPYDGSHIHVNGVKDRDALANLLGFPSAVRTQFGGLQYRSRDSIRIYGRD